MINKNHFFNSSLIILFLCVRAEFANSAPIHSYGPAYLFSNKPYLITPTPQEGVFKKNYFSFNINSGVRYYDNESNLLQQLYWHRSYFRKYMNFSFGGSAFTGEYRVEQNEPGDGTYFYYGYAVNASCNFVVEKNKIVVKPFGIYTGFSQENGSYNKFRETSSSWNPASNPLRSVVQGLIFTTFFSEFEINTKLRKCLSVGYCIAGPFFSLCLQTDHLGFYGQLWGGWASFSSSLTPFGFGLTYITGNKNELKNSHVNVKYGE